MASKQQAPSNQPDFSAHSKFSDIVLVVEEERFHVHRSILAMWSPVFEKMFLSDFKEKDKAEIPLPGKKASEIKEMLLMMYPSLGEKVINRENCYFLLKLADEYQMETTLQKSEQFLVSMVESKTEDDLLALLIFAQEYKLKQLIATCVYEARRLSLQQLKSHVNCHQIEPDNYQEIVEGIIGRLEKQLATAQEVKSKGLNQLRDVAEDLAKHAYRRTRTHYDLHFFNSGRPAGQLLDALDKDKSDHICKTIGFSCCPGLCLVSNKLRDLKTTMESLYSD